MPQIINTNISSLTAQRNLNSSQDSLNVSLQRLSSGLRINSARDDAAGLAISNQFTSQVRGLNQAIRNANDGISVAQVAEGALGETTNLLQRIRELSIQSANATNGTNERNALQAEVSALTAEIDRIANTTSFGSRSLLTGTFVSQSFQVGAQANETIQVSIASARAADLGAIESVDFANFASAAATASSATPASGVTGQTLSFSVDGVGTNVAITAGESAQSIADRINASVGALSADATTGARVTFTNIDTAADAVTLSINGVSLGSVASPAGTEVELGALVTAAIQGNSALSGLTVTDNADGTIDIVDSTGADITVEFDALNDASGGTPPAVAVQALESDGTTVSGTNQALTLTQGTVVTGDIDFTTSVTGATITAATSDGSGGIFSATGPNAGTLTTGTLRVSDIDISSVSGANQALGLVDAAIQAIDSQRGDLGAVQSRLQSTIANLSNVVENVSAARSRIQDADFAAETANLTRNQILQQAGISVLAQANALPQQVLSLLQ